MSDFFADSAIKLNAAADRLRNIPDRTSAAIDQEIDDVVAKAARITMRSLDRAFSANGEALDGLHPDIASLIRSRGAFCGNIDPDTCGAEAAIHFWKLCVMLGMRADHFPTDKPLGCVTPIYYECVMTPTQERKWKAAVKKHKVQHGKYLTSKNPKDRPTPLRKPGVREVKPILTSADEILSRVGVVRRNWADACDTIAKLIRENLINTNSPIGEVRATADRVEDGPFAPGCFRHSGQPHDGIGPKQWKLLHRLWDHDSGKPLELVARDDLVKATYGRARPRPGTFERLVGDLNKTLLEKDIPYSACVTARRSGSYRLQFDG